jgi:hypothetical protein
MKAFETVFAGYGKALDEFAEEVKEHAKPLSDKFNDLHSGLKEGLKTADRRGFDRAIGLASTRAGLSGHEDVANLIKVIPYIPPEG